MISNLVRRARTWGLDEAGNVTIDWVVLVAMALGMSFAVMVSISGGVNDFGDKAETELASREVGF
jgi:di/tricarboxylate transporter